MGTTKGFLYQNFFYPIGINTAVPPDAADLDNDADTAESAPYDAADSPRFVDDAVPDTGNGTPPIVDMGAYERQ